MAFGNFSKKWSDTKVDKTGMSLSLIVLICYQLNSWTEDEVLVKKPNVDNLFWKGLKDLLSKQTCKFLLHKQWMKRVLSSLAKIWKIFLSSQVSLCFSVKSFSQTSVLLKIRAFCQWFLPHWCSMIGWHNFLGISAHITLTSKCQILDIWWKHNNKAFKGGTSSLIFSPRNGLNSDFLSDQN